MTRKLLLLIVLIIVGSAVSIAQTGTMKVTLTDKATAEPIPFASVTIEQDGRKVAANQTNFDGEITFSALTPGRFDIRASYIGYGTKLIKGIVVSGDKTTYLPIQMETDGGKQLEVVEIVWKAPLISADVSSRVDIDRKDFGNLVSKDVTDIAAHGAGTFQADPGTAVSVRGSRSESTVYYVDGQRITGSLGVAQLGVEQITTITGGIPAQYGDVTGGIISVTTRGVQPNFFASVQGESSQFLDQYGKNYLGFSIGSPIYSVRDTSGVKKDLIGFILSGDFSHVNDQAAAVVPGYQVNNSLLNSITQNPIAASPVAVGSNVLRGSNVTGDQISTLSSHQYAAGSNVNVNGKLKFRLTDNADLSVGATFNYYNSQTDVYSYELFNAVHDPQNIGNTINLNARFIQRFNSKTAAENDKSGAAITNAVFTLQSDYTNSSSLTQDPIFKDNLFQYGYVGQFNVVQGKQNYWVDATNNSGYYQSNYAYDPTKHAYVQQALPGDSLVSFTPSANNLSAANYTTDYFNLRGSAVHNLGEVSTGLGLINGANDGQGSLHDIYGLWTPTGVAYDQYAKSSSSQFRVLGNFSAIVKQHHNVIVGFEFQQQSQSSYSISPVELWTLMRSLEGNVLQQLDTAHPIVTQQGAYKYISYNPLYNAENQSQFDRSLRQQLGLAVNSTKIINIDGLTPNNFNLNMFSADNLINSGSSLVSYQGYDYMGNKLSSNPSFGSYFTAQDANGNYLRQVAPYDPIYIAGYIQDQFDIADLKIRAGVRIDRYDNNQMELKDPYLLYNALNAGQISGEPYAGTRPSNIPSYYVPYADNATSPTTIVGYRDPNTGNNGITNWYTPQGVLVNDPSVLAKNANLTQIYPILQDVNAQKTSINPNAFTAYVPVINVMPRLAFAFPISDLASFNANYDITTQRPTIGTNNGAPSQYLQWSYNLPSPFLLNPALKPMQTINYEFGYSQYLNDHKTVSLKISAFYREMRDMIQVMNMYSAFPSTYTTFGNLDFATVKGAAVSFDTRRMGNIQISANYTLQFAEGTGSGPTDAINLVNSGLPNLRILAPLATDRRHTFNVNIDYRYGEKKEYNGPKWIRHKGKDNEKIINVLENVGFSAFATAGSGTPYSRQANVTEGDASGITVVSGIAQRGVLQGTVNGSLLPWSYRLDFKIDKNINVTVRQAKEGKPAKVGAMNVYIRSLNLLNTQNILAVYKYSGNPNDDGYLSSPTGQQTIAAQSNPASFTSLYSLKVNNPGNYSAPRSILVGIIMNL